MAKLAVSIDQVSVLRRSRGSSFPSPAAAALLAELAGAHGIIARPGAKPGCLDRHEVRALKAMVQTRLILKMAPTTEMIGLALDVKPHMVVLAADKPDSREMEGALDLIANQNEVAQTVQTLRDSSVEICILIEPSLDQVKQAHRMNADKIRLDTGSFCQAVGKVGKDREFSRIVDCVKLASKLRLGVTLGNGLCYRTVEAFKGFGEIEAFHIGHAIVSRAVLVGMERAVSEMLFLVGNI